MGKNIYFTGQPLYAQLLKLTDVHEIAWTSQKGGHDRYTQKLDGYTANPYLPFIQILS